MFTENYSAAQVSRLNWVDDDPEFGAFGEVTYVGTYCVVTGLVDPEIMDNRISVMYYVGDGALSSPVRHPVKQFCMETYAAAKAAHDALVTEAWTMDYIDYVQFEM